MSEQNSRALQNGPASDIQTRRVYLASVASFCAYACGHPDAREVEAAIRILNLDVPRTLAKLERAE